MSLAKKSVKWLAAAIVVFALVLTAVFAAGTVASASAEVPTVEVDALVVATDTGLNPTYPDFLYEDVFTVRAEYYFEMPDVEQEAVTTPSFAFAPVLTFGQTSIRPTEIHINQSFSAIGEIDEDTLEGYLAGNATIFWIDFDFSAAELADISGVSAGSPVSNAYLFYALYEFEGTESVGEYTFAFAEGTHFAVNTAAKYVPVLATESFCIRSTVELPTPAELTYSASEQIALVNTNNYTVSGDSQTNAGEYTVANGKALTVSLVSPTTTIWNLGNGTYSTADQSIEWSIAKKAASLSFVDPETYTKVYKAGFTVYPEVTYEGIFASDVDAFDLDYVGLPDVNAAVGSYPLTITYDADQDANYTVTAQENVSYVITVKSITIPESAETEYWYTGSAQTFEFTEDPLTDAEYFTVSGNEKTLVGEYTVTVSLLDTDNTQWAGGGVVDKTYSFVIQKADPEAAITIPVSDGDLRAYNGSAVTIGTSGTEFIYEINAADLNAEVGFVWEESDGNGGWTALGAAPANAGSYRVHITLSETANYNAGSSNYRSFAITKAAQSVTVATANKIYDGAVFGAAEYTVTTNSGETPVLVTSASLLSSQTSFTPGADAATYNFKVYIPGNGNFNAYLSETQTVVISPLALTVNPINVASVDYCSNVIESFTGDVSVTASGDNVAPYARYLSYMDIEDLASELTYTLNANTTIRNAGTYVDGVSLNITAVANDTLSNFTFTTGTANAVVNKINNAISVFLADGETALTNGASAKTYDAAAITADVEDADIIYATLENDGTVSYAFYADNNGVRGSAIAAPTLAGTYWIGVSATEGTNHLAVAEEFVQFVIDRAVVSITFTYSLGDGTAIEIETLDCYVCEALPAVPTFRYFDTDGFKFDDTLVTVATLEMDDETLNASYFYNVGKGDADGDGVITARDIIKMKRAAAGLEESNKIATESAAWELRSTTGAYGKVFTSALDVVAGDGGLTATDIVAVREALATGYEYKTIIDREVTEVTGQAVVNVDAVLVTTYPQFVAAVRKGYPVVLGCDIDAATETYVEDIKIPVNINLATYRLTVMGFTLNTDTPGATLRIANGTLYTVNGISVTAPNGNVIVSGVNGYSYDGTSVVLAAYSSSLHIESNVAFYIYHVKDEFNQPVPVADFAATVDADDAISELADTRIQDTSDRMNEIAQIKQNQNLSEEQKATQINAKEVKKAIIEVPIDTHVVVEESASLSVDKVVVKEQSNTEAAAVTTFSIEVKNADAEVVTVDVTEVKSDDGVNVEYYVEEVEIAANTDKVEIIKAEEQEVDVAKYVAKIGTVGYETLQAAINAAANFDTIKLLTNVTDGTGLEIKDGTVKNITIDFNGKTYTMVTGSVGSTGTETQAMHWSNNSKVTLKNGNFVVAASAATVPGTNGKVVKMAMQNYATLLVQNMTMDFSEIVVRNYGTYTGADAPYSGLEIPLFNLNAGSMTIENTTITLPDDSTKGVLVERPDTATIKNSTIEGYVALGVNGNVTIVDSTVGGVVSYFAGYEVKHVGNEYHLGGVEVSTAAELQAALNAGALIIDIIDDFAASAPITIASSVTINGNDHTITSTGNRIVNVTEPELTIVINDLTLTSTTSERGLNIWDSATDSDITLNNVHIDAHLYAINYVNGADNAVLTVNDSYLKGWGAINAHFNDSAVTVNNSTLYGINRTNDHTYAFNTVTIDGDSLNGAQEGDHGVNNTFVFDGCTIIAEVRDTHQYWISFQYAASGNTATVVVNNCEILDGVNGNDKTYDMQINGTNNAVVLALNETQYAQVAAKHYTIVNNGNGTYSVSSAKANIDYFGTAYNFYNVFENGWLEDTEGFTLTDDVTLDVDVVFARSRAAAIAVSGGTFTMNLDGYTISGEGKIYLPEGVTCVTDSSISIASLFVAPEGAVIIESIDADGNYIYAVNKAYVKTRTEFNNAITAGAKYIVVEAKIALMQLLYSAERDLTIDLNGNEITLNMTAGLRNSSSYTMTIVDSSNGNGKVTSTSNYAVYNYGAGEINVYGGTFSAKSSAAIMNGGAGTINIYGGSFTTVNADKYAILSHRDATGEINIFDGTFTADVAASTDGGSGTVNIYGGTFSADPSDFVAPGYVAVEDNGTWTVAELEITITTFAELKAAIADVNAGNIVYPTLIIANDIAFEEELTISKSVYIMGDGEVKFIGYDASTKYDEAFYINVADEDQEITIDGIVFDHFCYYSNVANKTKATADAVKNGVAYITYGGNCPASTTLYITGCQFLGTARDMINASSTIGCKGFIAIEDCTFDATDRLSSTLNMLSFYGNEDAELSVIIEGCTFKEASEQNATWATSAIASFGNADITVVGCEFIACQIAVAIDNTFDRLFSTSTYPVYHNTTVNLVENTYTNCYFGYYGEFIVEDVSEIPEEAELSTDEPFTYGDEVATQFHFAAEYDIVEGGTQGVDAKYLVVACYYVAA